MSRSTKRGRRVLAALAMTAGIVAVSAMPSQAAVAHTAKICAEGNYHAYLSIPQQGGITTYDTAPGQCNQIPVANGTTYVNVWGIYNNAPYGRKFYVGTWGVNPSRGVTLGAEGTTTSPWIRDFG